jgi:serine protease AprX
MFSRRLPLALAAVLVALSHAAAFAQGSDHKIDRGLRAALKTGAPTQRVIISVNAGCRDYVRGALQKHGDRIKSEHPIIDAIAVDLHSEDVQELAQNDCIKTLSYDAPVSAKAETSRRNTTLGVSTGSGRKTNARGSTPLNPLRETLGLPAIPANTTLTGFGVGVAIIDSGIAPNDDFDGRITGFYDFTRGGGPTTPYDDYGHGTHIAGLIASSGKLSNYQTLASRRRRTWSG